jgi:5'-nucleotidase
MAADPFRPVLRAPAVCALLFLLAGPLAGCASDAAGGIVDIQVLDISDWHGHVDAFRDGRGGAGQLTTLFARERAARPTLVVDGGDSFGATPPLSALFGDEPAARAMRIMGVDVAALGNHDFDAGVAHLRSLMPLTGAAFVSANLHGPELPEAIPFVVRDVGGVRVAVVGLENPALDRLVLKGRLENLTLDDATASANAAARAATAQGAQVVVLVAHAGVDAAGRGDLASLAANVTGFDAVLGDHTNAHYSASVGRMPVAEALSYGVEVVRLSIRYDRSAGRLTEASASFVPVSGLPRDAAAEAMLQEYRIRIAPAMDERLAISDAEVPRAARAPLRFPVGDLLADALRADARAEIGIMNPGGVRDGIPSEYVPLDATLRRSGSGPFDVVRGDAKAVMPFDNRVVSGTATGADVKRALEAFLAMGAPPIVSGMHLTYDMTLPAGSRLVLATLDAAPCAPLCASIPSPGQPLLDAQSYRVATTDFVANGGDGVTSLAGLREPHALLVDAFADHLHALGHIAPSDDVRARPAPAPPRE